MRLQPETVSRLTQTIAQKRQFTMAEQVQAAEVLAILRAEALRFFSLPHVCGTKKQEGDTPYIAKLRQRGLFEIFSFASSGAIGEALQPFTLALVSEAANDYNQRAEHVHAQPPQIAMALIERAKAERERGLAERVDALEALRADAGPTHVAYDTLKARLDVLEAAHDALSKGHEETALESEMRYDEAAKRLDALEKSPGDSADTKGQ